MLERVIKRLRSTLHAYWPISSSVAQLVLQPVTKLFAPEAVISLSRLPLELVAMILNELAVLDELDGGTASAPMTAPSREIRMALSRCARVSRCWYPLAQAHLYRSIVVVNLRQCEAFVRAIELNSDLALIPRNLVLLGGPGLMSLASDAVSELVNELLGRRHDLLVRVLRLCTQLERVRSTNNLDVFCTGIVDALCDLKNLSALYFRPHILEVFGEHFSLLQAHDILSRLPDSLEYLFVDSTIVNYDFLHSRPPRIALVEYQLSGNHEACDPTFVFEELEADLVEGIKPIPGGHIRVLHEKDVDSDLVERVVAGFAAQGVELAAVKTA